MGMIDRLIGMGPTVSAVGQAATGMAEVFTANATRRMELDEEAYARALTQLGQEFQAAPAGGFNRFVDGLNRMPRPLMTLGVIGLFAYAMIEPIGFSARMQGLALVPEPLWWLLGAIVSFYFGAREAYHFRNRGGIPARPAQAMTEAALPITATRTGDDFADNAALRDWAATKV
ncbi:holin family protein [uncultured Paracoccus sp.]|uniref:holin family protein n=1 Tax=uncultured Paracoccus sp. TaxID=189685 RepID=UPI002633C37A|nr:holin family protein [uncultured Paracoccus sp.]